MCDKNPEKIKNMFNEISPYYDKINNFISFGTHNIIKKIAIKKLDIKPNSKILDLCCGTGDFSKIITKSYPNSQVVGVDFSEKMIELAQKKNLGKFIVANATDLPFQDNEFDYVTMGFGLRNIENRENALSEIYRVLKPNGKFLHLDFGNHNFAGKIFDIFVPILVFLLKGNAKHYKYLLKSKQTYPEPQKLIEEFSHSGFKYVLKKDFLFGSISTQIVKK